MKTFVMISGLILLGMRNVSEKKVKYKGKVFSRTGHEGPEME